MPHDWQPIETAPKDGTPIWAYLFQTGIKLVRWVSAEEAAHVEGGDPSEYDPMWTEVHDWEEVWYPKYWLPKDALPEPPHAA